MRIFEIKDDQFDDYGDSDYESLQRYYDTYSPTPLEDDDYEPVGAPTKKSKHSLKYDDPEFLLELYLEADDLSDDELAILWEYINSPEARDDPGAQVAKAYIDKHHTQIGYFNKALLNNSERALYELYFDELDKKYYSQYNKPSKTGTFGSYGKGYDPMAYQAKMGTKPEFYVFVYGSLTDPKQMLGHGLEGQYEYVGVATLPNYRLELLKHANMVQARGDKCKGVLWKVSERMLDDLDIREGHPYSYKRTEVKVRLADGQTVKAYTYLMTDKTRGQRESHPPADEYVGAITNGYKEAGIPLSQLNRALARNRQTIDREPVRGRYTGTGYRSARSPSGDEHHSKKKTPAGSATAAVVGNAKNKGKLKPKTQVSWWDQEPDWI